jgi:hypothetical protein
LQEKYAANSNGELCGNCEEKNNMERRMDRFAGRRYCPL